jgi:translation initiation factor IF-1
MSSDRPDKVLAVVDGVIMECLPATEFVVRITDENFPEDYTVRAKLSGKMRLHYIKILPGDKVRLDLNPYDVNRGRITYRYKAERTRPPRG